MSFFESLLLLLLSAIVLLQVSRRLSLPYPAMLAAAGVVIALIPGAPNIRLDPDTALALFIAPALVDAGFDFPVGAVWRLWRPLFALAVVAVLLTAGAVTWLGMSVAGLPFYAALALGAAVAPPDAAAATAVLSSVRLPRRAVAVLKGESLLNDASALLLFGLATALASRQEIGIDIELQLAAAAPGGVLLGILLAWLYQRLLGFVSGTLGGNLLEFVTCFGVWILAEHLHLSPVLCLVAFAMTIARRAGLRQSPRARVHSFAVWDTVVFLLNVLAFLLMGMQARSIIGGMTMPRFLEAMQFAGLVVLAVIGVRLLWVLAYNQLARRMAVLRGDDAPYGGREGLLIGWCGMRGLVTLATAFALPGNFPQRDLIVLTAFAVVLATLVIQGLTLAPLTRWLKLQDDDSLDRELRDARDTLAQDAIAVLEDDGSKEAALLRQGYALALDDLQGRDPLSLDRKRDIGDRVIARQRKRLEQLRAEHRVGADAYLVLQEELDFKTLAMASEEDRKIEES